MGKRSTAKKRGIPRGLSKHKIKSKPVLIQNNDGERTILGIRESVYYSTARFCFNFWFSCCSKLYLIPFTRTLDGKYVRLKGSKAIISTYCAWLLKFIMLLHKLVGLGIMLWSEEELRIETFMCVTYFLVYFVSFCISLVIFTRPEETMGRFPT